MIEYSLVLNVVQNYLNEIAQETYTTEYLETMCLYDYLRTYHGDNGLMAFSQFVDTELGYPFSNYYQLATQDAYDLSRELTEIYYDYFHQYPQ